MAHVITQHPLAQLDPCVCPELPIDAPYTNSHPTAIDTALVQQSRQRYSTHETLRSQQPMIGDSPDRPRGMHSIAPRFRVASQRFLNSWRTKLNVFHESTNRARPHQQLRYYESHLSVDQITPLG